LFFYCETIPHATERVQGSFFLLVCHRTRVFT
jgi:hypothetical protein